MQMDSEILADPATEFSPMPPGEGDTLANDQSNLAISSDPRSLYHYPVPSTIPSDGPTLGAASSNTREDWWNAQSNLAISSDPRSLHHYPGPSTIPSDGPTLEEGASSNTREDWWNAPDMQKFLNSEEDWWGTSGFCDTFSQATGTPYTESTFYSTQTAGPSSGEAIYSGPLQHQDEDQPNIRALKISIANLQEEFSKLKEMLGQVIPNMNDIGDSKAKLVEITGICTKMGKLCDEAEDLNLILEITRRKDEMDMVKAADDHSASQELSDHIAAMYDQLYENKGAMPPVNKKRSLAMAAVDGTVHPEVTCIGQSSKQTDNRPVNPKFWTLEEINNLVQAVEELATLDVTALQIHMKTWRSGSDIRRKWTYLLEKATVPVDKRRFLNGVIISDQTLQKAVRLNANVMEKMLTEKRALAEQRKAKQKGKAKANG